MKTKYILLFTIPLFIFSCQNGSNEIQEPGMEETAEGNGKIILTEKQFSASEYEIGKAEKKTFKDEITVNGMVDLPLKNISKVTSYLGGIVDGMSLLHGQWVNKGQLLFRITNPDLVSHQQEYLELKGQINYLESEYQRQKQLSDEQISAKKDFLKAESELNIARAKMSGIAQKLKLYGIDVNNVNESSLVSTLNINAPHGGYLTSIEVVNGDYLHSGTPAMEVSNTSHLHLELKVLEKDVNKIDIGQEVTYFLQSDPGKLYKGDIHLIDKMVDENRMINVHTHIDDPEPPHITTGMFVTAMIETEEQEGFALPENAVVTMEGKEYVLVQESDGSYTFTPLLVETGIKKNGYVQILSPIDTSASYLVKGGYYVLM